MLAKEETQSRPSSEIKIIPAWAWILAGVAFVATLWFLGIAVVRQPEPHPISAWGRQLFGLVAGILVGCYVLFVGYINRDSKRRGMSPIPWTILAIFMPYALGIVLYFLLRLPLRSVCPQCEHEVQPGFSFCPHCSYKLAPSCPQCQRSVGVNDIYCPYCATQLGNPTGPVSSPPTGVPG